MSHQQPGYGGGSPQWSVSTPPGPQLAPSAHYSVPVPATAHAPVRIEPVSGTEFGVAYLSVPPTVSGLAVGGLVAGIGSVSIAFVVGCFGVAGGNAGWGPIVAGAFAVLAGLLGFGAAGLGYAAQRQVQGSRGRITGRGLAIAGIACGGTGFVLTAAGMLLSVILVAT